MPKSLDYVEFLSSTVDSRPTHVPPPRDVLSSEFAIEAIPPKL